MQKGQNPKKKKIQPSSDEMFANLPKAIMEKLSESEEYKMQGDHHKALQIAQKILEKMPDCLPAAEEVADNLLSIKEFEKAKNVALYILSLDAKSSIANYVIGFLLLTDNKNKKALPFLKMANDGSANNPEILRCLGWSLFHTGDEIAGIATLERALNLRSDDPLILCDLGVCLLQKHIFEKSITLFERALSLDPSNDRASECLKAAISFKESVLLLHKE